MTPNSLEPKYPFEWSGIFELSRGTHQLVLQSGPTPVMKFAVLPANGNDCAALEAVLADAMLVFAGEDEPFVPGNCLVTGHRLHELHLPGGEMKFRILVDSPGTYALFTEHDPGHFQAKLLGPHGEIRPAVSREYLSQR